ncbi:MAG: S8 family serine peptidase [Fimbriimonas sp.]
MKFALNIAIALAALPLGAFAKDTPRVIPNRQQFLAHMPTGPMNEILGGQVLVKFRPSFAERLMARKQGRAVRNLDTNLPAESAIVPGGKIHSRIASTGWTLWRVPAGTDIRSLVEKLKRNPDVLTAQPSNRIYPLLPPPDDKDWNVYEDDSTLIFSLFGDVAPFRRLWHLEETQALEGWGIWPNKYYTAATKPVETPLIAVIDTGCDLDHPDFRNKNGISTDVIFGGQLDLGISARFELGEVVPGLPVDLNGHGTHVAGIALAAGNNGAFSPSVQHGTIGTGYPCKGMILRVFDDGGVGSDADAAAAMYYAVDNGADIINLSLGTTNFSQLFQDAVTYAFQRGALVVAAGNENGSGGGDLGPIYPAACSGTLAVTANGENRIPAVSTYSGYGPYIDIAAPGGDVFISTDPTDPQYKIQFVWSTSSTDPTTSLHLNTNLVPPYNINYAYLAGTSMACPAVAGAAGLYYGKNNLDQVTGWANLKTYRALEQSATNIMGAPRGSWEYYQGYGSLDIESLLLDSNARGATVGGLEGIIYFNGTALGNVTIRAQRPGSRIRYQTTSRLDGGYRFEMLPPGLYNVTAVAFGAARTKAGWVNPGSDLTGFDFWCGTYTGDETAPTIGRFDLSRTANSFSFTHWAYDTETGIDKMSIRLGTTVGAQNILTDTEVFPESNNVTRSGLTIPVFNTFQARYTNGANMEKTVTSAVIPVAEDSFVRDGTFATTNYGSSFTISTVNKGVVTFNRRAYFKIDTSAVPGTVSKVLLRFQAAKWASANTSVSVNAYPTSTAWSQNTLTWNNAPSASAGPISAVTITNPGYVFNWYTIDITNYVRAERDNGRPVVSLYLQTPTAIGEGVDIRSRENTTSIAPQVIIEAQS